MPHLDASTLERLAGLERDLKQAMAMAMQPKFDDARRMYWQARARTIQAQIEVIEQMAESSRLTFEGLEAARQEELLP